MTAPAKANNAPKPSVTTVGTGLVSALNNHQAVLKQRGLIEIEDQYAIEFADNIIAGASIVPPGTLDKSLAAGASGGTAAQQLLPNRQSMDPGSRGRAASVGQQIVQFIDEVIRSSTYIQEQSGQTWNQTAGTWSKEKRKTADQFAWFQVLCDVEQLEYDNLRNDFAYRMKFLIVPFETPMLSTYFPSGKYRGTHKSYAYWFTGENNSILSFEQSFNSQWTQAITGTLPPDNRVERVNDRTDFVQRWRTNVYPASSQSNQGGDKLTMEPGANAADFLYSADLMTVTVNIVGDPAWLPGAREVTKETFSSRPFLSDGTINTTASAAYFEVSFNTPADYNLNTGLIDFTNQESTTTNRQQKNNISTLYYARESTSNFKAGKFTQVLKGTWVTHTGTPPNVGAREPVVKRSAQSRKENQSRAETVRLQNQNAAASPSGTRAPGGLGSAIRSPNNNQGTKPLNTNIENAPTPRGPILGLSNPAPPPGSIDPVTLLPINRPNPNPGQVMNREP